MYLDRDYRGRGIAARMIECAEARARALGFGRMIFKHCGGAEGRDYLLSQEWLSARQDRGGRCNVDQDGGWWPHAPAFREAYMSPRDHRGVLLFWFALIQRIDAVPRAYA